MEDALQARYAVPATDSASTTLSPSVTTTIEASTTSPASTIQTLPTARDSLPAFPSALLPSNTSTASASASASPTQDAGPVSYYFVFFALILCVLAFAGFLFWRRRRMLSSRNARRTNGSTRSGAAATGSGHQPWLSMWRAAEVSREEGLNEEGEAPPPYVSKAYEETGRRDRESGMHAAPNAGEHASAIPLQTLGRQSAENPPGYVQAGNGLSASTGHGASSSRQGS